MIQELGESLADDLIARHKTAEESLPASKKGQFIIKNPDFPDREDLYRYKNFAGLRQVAEEKHSTSASLTMKAEVEEESMFAAMDAAMDDEPSFATNAGNTTRPKPNTQKKAEVKSDEQKLTVANNGANRMLTECQALQNKLQRCKEVSDKYKNALLEDLVAAEGQLTSAKHAAVTALATKTDVASALADLKSKCDLFKKVSDPVKACLRKADPSSKAKAKKRAKPAAE